MNQKVCHKKLNSPWKLDFSKSHSNRLRPAQNESLKNQGSEIRQLHCLLINVHLLQTLTKTDHPASILVSTSLNHSKFSKIGSSCPPTLHSYVHVFVMS